MTLNPTQLADDIRDAIGQDPPTSDKTINMAQDIVDHIMTGIVNHLPDTVEGNAPPSGGSLLLGKASSGTITLVPADLTARFIVTFGVSTPEILGMGTSISTHLMTGLVEFAEGNITGACSNTLVNPGTLTGAGTAGTITGLSGPILATLMATSMAKPGPSAELSAMCGAIVDHVMNNAEVTYAMGSVTGTCSAGGGPIVAGTGSGGTIE
jgi:hypothetical protein